jgi:hypothetical protein
VLDTALVDLEVTPGIPRMHIMLEPSDPIGAKPINRLISPPSWKEHALRALQRVQLEEQKELRAIENEESEAISKITDQRGMYRAVFSLTRAEVATGRSSETIRAEFREVVTGHEALAATIHEAIEDALAGRPPRW